MSTEKVQLQDFSFRKINSFLLKNYRNPTPYACYVECGRIQMFRQDFSGFELFLSFYL